MRPGRPGIPPRRARCDDNERMTNTIVQDDPARRRFEILIDGSLAGVADYELRDGLVVFTHTEVGADFQDKGVGSALARGALDQVRQRGDRIVAECAFIAGYVQRHPQYQDLMRT